ncbi:MAG: quinol oxidase [Thermodesulfovibrionales bacterium]
MKGLVFVLLLTCVAVSGAGAAEEEAVVEKAEAVLGEDGVQRVEVVAGSYFFTPNYIVLKAGIPAELVFKKEPGLTPHNVVLMVEGQQVRVDISTEGTTVKLTPTTAGKIPFYCDKKFLFFPSHREKGMEGVIEVVE